MPLRSFRELAFAMTVGLVLDAFLVRTLLVPALISIVGERSGWPGRQLRGNATSTEAAIAMDSGRSHAPPSALGPCLE